MRDRVRDSAILLAVTAAITLPNLGATSLWDVDEGVNAQAAREMREADTWVIPTFNYQLRTAKPVMLYWLQRGSYDLFGVSEWSARLPSVLAGWVTVLLTYELARRLFDRLSGLLAGVVLASAVQFSLLSRAATPDAALLMFTTAALLAFWVGHRHGARAYWLPTAAACGLAVLTKGPVGLALPALVIWSYFAWNRELSRTLDFRLVGAGLVFLLVAGPWYGFVASETRGEWVKAFLERENLGRFLQPLEGHRGPLWYYPVAILVMFAPWSAFLGASLWYAFRGTRKDTAQRTDAETVRGYRFLVCWIAVYLLFFTAAATKLPNYVYPVYPPLAILTARFLTGWHDGNLPVPRWVMPVGLIALGLVGAVATTGLLLAEARFPGLRSGVVCGLLPVAAAVVAGRQLATGRRAAVIATTALANVLFVGLLSALLPPVIDRQKAPRPLVRASNADDPDRDIRVATFGWFQPSVVFYTGRQVETLTDAAAAVTFLEVPTPAFLFVAESAWEALKSSHRLPAGVRVVARHHDFLRDEDVFVVSNTPADDGTAASHAVDKSPPTDRPRGEIDHGGAQGRRE